MINKINIYRNKRILVTGHTGFKGSWLCLWLKILGAKVYGVSIKESNKRSNYKIFKIDKHIRNYFFDIKNYNKLNNLVNKINPEIIFHLAAKSIISYSYDNPIKTFNSNVFGTINLLEILRKRNKKVILIITSSDKIYKNNNKYKLFKEDDVMGGDDIYSASKTMMEHAINSYSQTYFKNQNKIKISTARSGNVIGGGDWSNDRIIPDIMESWNHGKKVILRNPNHIRPWQNLFDTISGYLVLASFLYLNKIKNFQCYNFGPNKNTYKKVIDIANLLSKKWRNSKISQRKSKNLIFTNEKKLLLLDSKKASKELLWKSSIKFEESINLINNWYIEFYNNKKNIYDFSNNQINEYRFKDLKKYLFKIYV